MDRFLSQKTAIVTGSTRGIGLGIARALAARGANLVLNGFPESDEISQLTTELATTHQVAVWFEHADLAQPAEIEAMMHRCQARPGGVDILVNNAGIQHVAPIEDFPPEKWDALIAVNLSAAFHTIRLALPEMRRRGWGRIVNVASAHGLVASAGKSAYVAAKHGLVGLTKAVALETARTGVTCNAICPGWVHTPLVEAQIESRAAANGTTLEAARELLLLEKQPSGEFVTTEQIGELVAFLCSPAGNQIRGASWSIDGGWVAQ